MADFVLGWTVGLLVSNNSDKTFDATGKATFAPPLNTRHLAGQQDYHQYSEKLYGHADGDFNHSSVEEGEEVLPVNNGSLITEEGKLLEKKLADLAAHAKTMAPIVPTDIRRPRLLVSMTAGDYGGADICFYFPGRAAQAFDPSISFACWMGDKCVEKNPARGRRKDHRIKEHKVKHRRAEGTDLAAYVIYPEYFCTKCETSKSAMDSAAMAAMKIPPFILNQSPVVALENSAITRELFEDILMQMPSELGAAQIRTLCRKKRAALYINDARAYSECHAYMLLKDGPQSSGLHRHGFSGGPKRVPFLPFPPFPSAFRPDFGLSKSQIAEIYIAAHNPLGSFCDAVQGSIGGQVLKSDGCYSRPCTTTKPAQQW
jgi:hypothetical protein